MDDGWSQPFLIFVSEINRLRKVMEDQGNVWENVSDDHENATNFSYVHVSNCSHTNGRKKLEFSGPRHPNTYWQHVFGAWFWGPSTPPHQVWLEVLRRGVYAGRWQNLAKWSNALVRKSVISSRSNDFFEWWFTIAENWYDITSLVDIPVLWTIYSSRKLFWKTPLNMF